MKRHEGFQGAGIAAVSAAALLGGVTMTLATPRVACAQAATAAPQKVTLNVKDKTVYEVLEKLFQDAKVDFVIVAASPGMWEMITVNVKEASFAETIEMILRKSETPLKHVIQDGVHVILARSDEIGLKAPVSSVKTVMPTVTLDLIREPLMFVLARLFQTAKWEYKNPSDFVPEGDMRRFLKGVPVSLKVTNASFENVLHILLNSSYFLTYTKENGVYILQGRKRPAAPSPTSTAVTPPTQPANVSIDYKDTPIREALEKLFRAQKLNFSIDPTIQGYVNIKATDIPFENALKLILRSSTRPLTYTKEDGVYLIKPRTMSQVTPGLPPVPSLAAADVPPRSQYELIELTYADPADLAQLLNITMIPIGTRFGLNVPGASGIIRPGAGRGNGGGTTAGGTGAATGGGGTIISSGGTGGGGNGIAF